MFVTVNDERIKLYNNDKLTIFDAAVQYGLPNEDIFAKRGADITFKINGKSRIVRGYTGEPAYIELNGRNVGMNALIEADDVIHIKKSTVGDSAHIELGNLPEYSGSLTFTVNDTVVNCPKFAIVNGNPESSLYQIKDGDDIEMQNYYTLEQLFTFMDIEPVSNVYINNAKAALDDKIFDNFVVSWIRDDELKDYITKVNVEDDDKKIDDIDDITDKNFNEEGIVELHVIVNDTPVVLKGKSEYRFVDVLDFYDFDLKDMQGKKLISNQDGHHAEFIELLHENSRLDLYWEK
jgi:hypothetical protein